MNRPLRIVLVHRYFYPDTPPYANMLRAIAVALSSAGHQVTVLTCQPSYNRAIVSRAPRLERIDGFDVVRWRVLGDRSSSALKVLNLLAFVARLVTSKHFAGADVVMSGTTPPVLISAICGWIARRRGAAFVYHKQDIWPEVAGPQHRLAKRALFRALKWVDLRTEKRAARIVVLSGDMAHTIAGRGGVTDSSITVLNNFDPWEIEERSSSFQPASTLRVVFAGGLGRFQGLEDVARLIRLLQGQPIEWHFFGEGPLGPELSAADPERVVLHGYQPPAEVAKFIRDRADLGLVSLNPDVIRHAYPSKTLSYLRHGCPVLVLVEPDSELAEMVRSHDVGLIIDRTSLESTATALARLVEDRSRLAGTRARAHELYRARFERRQQLDQWVDLMEDVAS